MAVINPPESKLAKPTTVHGLKILKILNRLIRALWLYKADVELFLIYKLHTQEGQGGSQAVKVLPSATVGEQYFTAALPMPPPCSISQNPDKTAVATLMHTDFCSKN